MDGTILGESNIRKKITMVTMVVESVRAIRDCLS